MFPLALLWLELPWLRLLRLDGGGAALEPLALLFLAPLLFRGPAPVTRC